MTDILALLNRFEDAAGVYERSDDPAARDELHAARRAIVERDAELVKALKEARACFQLLIGEGIHKDALAGGIMASIDAALSRTVSP